MQCEVVFEGDTELEYVVIRCTANSEVMLQCSLDGSEFTPCKLLNS